MLRAFRPPPEPCGRFPTRWSRGFFSSRYKTPAPPCQTARCHSVDAKSVRFGRSGLACTRKEGGDAPAATAILDRFLHHAVMITISGKSYRLRNRAVPDANRERSKPNGDSVKSACQEQVR